MIKECNKFNSKKFHLQNCKNIALPRSIHVNAQDNASIEPLFRSLSEVGAEDPHVPSSKGISVVLVTKLDLLEDIVACASDVAQE